MRAATDEDLDELELEDFGGDDLPPPPRPMPPSTSSATAPPSPPPPALVALAGKIEQSTDPLERQTLAHAACLASMADVLADTTISAAERRRELRTIAAAAARLFPYARLYQAEQAVKQQRAELENRKRTRAGAKLEKRPTAGDGKVIPIRIGGNGVKS